MVTAEAISIPRSKAMALAYIAKAYVEAGQMDDGARRLIEAKRVAERAETPVDMVRALGLVGRFQARAGLGVEARITFGEAIAIAEYPNSRFESSMAIAIVAQEQAKAGLMADAAQTRAQAYRPFEAAPYAEEWRSRAAAEIVLAEVLAGHEGFSRLGLKDMLEITHDFRRSQPTEFIRTHAALSRIGAAQARVGQFGDAYRVSKCLEEQPRISLLLQIADEMLTNTPRDDGP